METAPAALRDESEDVALVRETARNFAQKRLKAIAEKVEESKTLPPGIFKELGDLGLCGLAIPEAYGGSAGSFLSCAVVMEELSRVSAAVCLSYGAHSFLCARNLYENASEFLRKKYLPKLCTGDWIGAFGLTEPGSGSDAASLQTKAVRRGNKFILNGTKIFITNGSIADVVLVFARTEKGKGRSMISAFLVEAKFKGFSVGRDIPKLGTRGSPLSELVFNNCEVPEENLVGEEGQGLRYMINGLDMERAVFSGMPVGIAQAALDYSLSYAVKRQQFRQPLSSFQLVQEMLAQMATEIEAARLLTYQAASQLDAGKSISKQASFAKLFGAQMVMRATQWAVQILGGYGFTRECPVERYYRDAALIGIGGGTSQIQTLIIAKELVKEANRHG